ncbi:hypothetical protein AJ80_05461 [Polytolypa hystricis UAMH7299]|uniref:L-type lectin-like domain-containing protein n=1 Tax=Polytolypa hystricis (strain UAMH7299) TaxID=1447883 RepID=A0A2B7Y3Z3_POLH7|nr:hypothetical protein AJ80_05461 [Polytolypa hystricis UAMH7299]
MLLQFAWYLFLWVLGLGTTGAHAQDENDFSSSSEYRKVPMRAFSISPPYLDSDMGNRWFDFGGDTVIRADKYIRLTWDRPSQQGWLWSRVPLTATNWQVEFEFKLHGEGNLHGDGFALWFTKERAVTGPVFGNKNFFEGLGIFFDTYKNGRPGAAFPYIMAMMGNGKTAYDQANDGRANEMAGCSARGLRGSSIPTKARITYFQDKRLALDLQYKSDGSWTQCFNIVNTDETPTNIPSVSYLGFTAETGELSDNHDLFSVEVFSLYNQKPSPGSVGHAPPVNKGPILKNKNKNSTGGVKQKSSWFWTLMKIVMFFGLLGGVYVGFTIYRASKKGRF